MSQKTTEAINRLRGYTGKRWHRATMRCDDLRILFADRDQLEADFKDIAAQNNALAARVEELERENRAYRAIASSDSLTAPNWRR